VLRKKRTGGATRGGHVDTESAAYAGRERAGPRAGISLFSTSRACSLSHPSHSALVRWHFLAYSVTGSLASAPAPTRARTRSPARSLSRAGALILSATHFSSLSSLRSLSRSFPLAFALSLIAPSLPLTLARSLLSALSLSLFPSRFRALSLIARARSLCLAVSVSLPGSLRFPSRSSALTPHSL
jgi:hypothetical protein